MSSKLTNEERLMKLETLIDTVMIKVDKIDTKIDKYFDCKLDKQAFIDYKKEISEQQERLDNWKRFWPVYLLSILSFILTLIVTFGLVVPK